MANKKISQLTEVTNPTSTDVIPVVNASETKKAQLGNLPISDATQSALDGKQDTLGYTAENVANRSTDVDADKTSLTKYPVVKAVYDWAVSLFATISQLNTKQDTLVSGTNIKTINSESLLGSGNIAIDLSPISVDGDKVSIAADTTATTQTTAVIQATDTNSGIAIVPNGTGAFTLQVPDNTATGGNARGQYTIDLQRKRTSASQVASGNHSFMYGENNTITGQRCFLGGGYGNSIVSNYGTIIGGYNNIITTQGEYSTINGGTDNTANNLYSTISGGRSNTASTNTHATVVGGYQNSSTGQYSISGGYSNVASGQGAVALGYDNTASGTRSVAIGSSNTATNSNGSYAIGGNNTVSGENSVALGSANTVSGRWSFAGGYQSSSSGTFAFAFGINSQANSRNSASFGNSSKTYLYGQFSQTGSIFTTVGDAQQSYLTSRKQDTLTTGATTTLSLDGTGTTNLIIPDGTNRVWNVTIKYTAVVTSIIGTATGVSVGDCKNEVLTIGFKKIGGTSSVVGSLNTLSTNEDISMSTASFGVTAGASQEMKLDFTAPTFLGGGSVTTRVVAKVELTEVAY